MLCLSLFLNWIPLAALGLICFDYPNGLIYSSSLIIAAGVMAISPVNESIGRKALGCRPATAEERDKVAAAWDAVVAAIGQALDGSTRGRFAGVHLFVSDERFPVAFALGRNTVCVTRGMVHLAAPGEIAGVLAHEAGHLHFGDSIRLAVAISISRIGVASYGVLDFLARICEGLGRGMMAAGRPIAGSSSGSDGIFGAFLCLMAGLAVVIATIAGIVIKMASFLLQKVADVSLGAVGRREEFRADLFAKNIGFGRQLAKYLLRTEALETAPKGVWAVLQRTHPPIAERIERLLQDVSDEADVSEETPPPGN
jgi:heat shock protein HtpX